MNGGGLLTEQQLERFWTKFDVGDDPNGCWEWKGVRNQEGYGYYGAMKVRAHRFLYELLVGPIPAGLQIDHLCRNPSCVNPAHMEPVTARQNTMRGIGITARNAAKTHCIHGHEFTPENTYVRPDGARHCLICRRATDARRYGSHLEKRRKRKLAQRV